MTFCDCEDCAFCDWNQKSGRKTKIKIIICWILGKHLWEQTDNKGRMECRRCGKVMKGGRT